MSDAATPKSAPESDDDSILSAEEQLERAYEHVTEAMTSGLPGEEPPMPETVGITAPTDEDYEQKLAAMKDALLRSAAEMENVRRRAQKDVEDAGKYAVGSLVRDLVSVIENLYRAVGAIPPSAREDNPTLKSLGDGVEMTLREFSQLLSRHGVKRIDPQGEAFDHNLHQAVTQIDSADHPPGTIMQVLQAGYTLHDRLIQPAMVGVSKASGDQPAPGAVRVDTSV